MNGKQIEITILMATYNGSAYLAAQLDSILSQDYHDWKLVIRDDGSTDSTLDIIEAYEKRDFRIKRIEYGTIHGSACKNFSQLTSWALDHPANYYMFADQDDIWEANKVAVSVQEIINQEDKYGNNLPQLCYSSFQFIDEKGVKLSQKLNLPVELQLRVLLNENHAWGCTMIINHSALQAIVPIPVSAVNHDYWIALVISALGKTKLIDKDLILYRQHTQNVSGSVDNMTFASRFKRYVSNSSHMLTALAANLNTIQQFSARYKSVLTLADNLMVTSFITAYESGTLKLLRTLLKFRIFKIGIGKNAVYFYTLCLLRKKVIAQTKRVS
jgi:glycosyltransferase involved in cell wall biosynthesis